MNPSILPITGYSLESKTRSPIEMKLLAMLMHLRTRIIFVLHS